MDFKLFLENNDVRVTQMDSDGSRVTIVYPSGIYNYEIPHHGHIVINNYTKCRKHGQSGLFANKLKQLVKNGHATVEKVG